MIEAKSGQSGQEPPSAALAADKTFVMSVAKTSVVSAAKKVVEAATSAATSDISMKSTTSGEQGAPTAPSHGVLDGFEMSDVAADVADVAAVLAADTTDVLAVDTTDVYSAAKAAYDGSCPAMRHPFNSKANVQ